MTRILVDHNLKGQARLLFGTLQSLGWIELLQLEFIYFDDVGLEFETSDRVIWEFVQTEKMILLTGNRNRSGVDSLQHMIEEENFPEALPIVTVSRQDGLLQTSYRKRCAARLIEIVVDLEIYRGAGRLFIP